MLLVPVNPIPVGSELSLVLHDLDRDAIVAIGEGGRPQHSARCTIPLTDHPKLLVDLALKEGMHQLQIVLPATRNGSGGYAVLPQARVLEPEMSPRTHPGHPHVWLVRATGMYWACPLGAHVSSWGWRDGSLLHYIDQMVLWDLKTMVWAATRRGFNGEGRWLGAEASHAPADWLRDAPLDGPCPCGFGARFRTCHFEEIRARQIHQSVYGLGG